MLRLPQLKLGPHLQNNDSRSPGHQTTGALAPGQVSGSFKERRKKYARKRNLVRRCEMVDPVEERLKYPSLPPSMMRKPDVRLF